MRVRQGLLENVQSRVVRGRTGWLQQNDRNHESTSKLPKRQNPGDHIKLRARQDRTTSAAHTQPPPCNTSRFGYGYYVRPYVTCLSFFWCFFGIKPIQGVCILSKRQLYNTSLRIKERAHNEPRPYRDYVWYTKMAYNYRKHTTNHTQQLKLILLLFMTA